MVILDKERIGDTEQVVMRNIIGDPKDKDVLLMDDEILSGGSIIEAAKMLQDHGANRIWAGCTHGFFTQNALDKIQESCIEEVVTTNTISQIKNAHYSKLKVLSVAQLFADAINAIHKGESVGALLGETTK
jgi:ribose-phosphate pyrophosphokinase